MGTASNDSWGGGNIVDGTLSWGKENCASFTPTLQTPALCATLSRYELPQMCECFYGIYTSQTTNFSRRHASFMVTQLSFTKVSFIPRVSLIQQARVVLVHYIIVHYTAQQRKIGRRDISSLLSCSSEQEESLIHTFTPVGGGC